MSFNVERSEHNMEIYLHARMRQQSCCGCLMKMIYLVFVLIMFSSNFVWRAKKLRCFFAACLFTHLSWRPRRLISDCAVGNWRRSFRECSDRISRSQWISRYRTQKCRNNPFAHRRLSSIGNLMNSSTTKQIDFYIHKFQHCLCGIFFTRLTAEREREERVASWDAVELHFC